jgi:hypothetical protein
VYCWNETEKEKEGQTHQQVLTGFWALAHDMFWKVFEEHNKSRVLNGV